MRKKLIQIVKYFKFVYIIYFYIGSSILKVISKFVKKDSKTILFVSFGGQRFNDSPKEIFDKIKMDPEFSDFKLVWAFRNPNQFETLSDEYKIKIDTVNYFKVAMKAGIWITNSSIERGLEFKEPGNFCINTWHGTPLKKMGTDISSNSESFTGTNIINADIFLTQSAYETKIMSAAYSIPLINMKKYGLPRNDILTQPIDSMKKNIIRQNLNIPINKKIILYAPTFREYYHNVDKTILFENKLNEDAWKKVLGDDYVMLLRTHYEIESDTDKISSSNNFIYDVSEYENLNDLMQISDILISDYSSIIFDFSILNKPMYTFTYDYDRYQKERGLYFDIREHISGSSDEGILIQMISKMNLNEKISEAREFNGEFVEEHGKGTEKIVQYIKNKTKNMSGME